MARDVSERPRRYASGSVAPTAGPPWLRQRRRDGGSELPWRVRCPYCRADDDKVVDSRPADEGAAVRRRRECLACGRRFTTYERVEEVAAHGA